MVAPSTNELFPLRRLRGVLPFPLREDPALTDLDPDSAQHLQETYALLGVKVSPP
jgi:hypothetical protein